MPRRKSTTLCETTSPMKRTADEEGNHESNKKRKNSESCDSQEISPVSSRPANISTETGTRASSSDKKENDSCELLPDVLTIEEIETVEIHEDIPATSVCEEGNDEVVVAAEDVVEETSDDAGGSLSERRNLSLEALFQVTDSELQNMSRETHVISGPSQLGGEVIVLGQLKSIVAPEKTKQAVIGDSTFTIAENLMADSQQCRMDNMKLVCSQPASEEFDGNQEVTYQIISSSTPTVINVTRVFATGRKRKHPQKPGRHICPFCGRGCAKPSVLQKHLRAHTGERPFPCVPCGFSFKTKSNLYKHCKSRSHAIKAGSKDAGNTGKEKDSTPDEKPGVEEAEEAAEEEEEYEEEEVGDDGSDASGGEPQNREVEEEEEVVQQEVSVVVHDEKVKQESILENIRQKIDRNKLMEWSKKVEKQQKQQNDALLQAHSQFPVRIAPKSEAAQLMEVGESSITEMEDVAAEDEAMELIGQPAVLSTSNAASEQELKDGGCASVVHSELAAKVSVEKKENALSSKPVSVSQGGLVLLAESVKIPPPCSEPSEATRALRQLETLSERVQQAAIKGIPISSSFCTLPDKSIKVTIQLPKIEQKSTSKDCSLSKGTSVKSSSTLGSSVTPGNHDQTTTISESATVGSALEGKPISSEMLKERIQNLINANAAIVDMPMADPPRPKARGLSRQYSDFYVYSWKLSDSESTDGSSPKVQVPLTQMKVDSDAQMEDNSSASDSGEAAKAIRSFPGRRAIQERLAQKIADTNRRRSLSDAEGEIAKIIPSSIGPEIKIKIKLTPQMASEMSAANPLLCKSQSPKTEGSEISSVVTMNTSSALRMQLSNVPLQSSVTQSVAVKGEASQSSSVIKDLLSKGAASGTLAAASKTGEHKKEIPRVEEVVEKDQCDDFGKVQPDSSGHSDDYGLFHCNQCKVSFKRAQTLQIHTRFYCVQRSQTHLERDMAGSDAQEAFIKMGKDIMQKYFPVNSPPPPLLRSRSCPAPAALSLEESPASKTGLIFENINDPSKPRKKGRPKGSKNRPKDLHVMPQANFISTVIASPATPQTPSHFKIPTPSTPLTPRLVAASPSATTDSASISIPATTKVVLPLTSLSPLVSCQLTPNLTSPMLESTIAPTEVRPVPTSLHVNKFFSSLVSKPNPIILSPGGVLIQASPAVLSPMSPSATVLSPSSSIPLIGQQKSVAMPMIGQPMVTMARTPVSTTSIPASPTTPVTPQTPTGDSGSSLWKMKLKGKLLLKRSMSVERVTQDKDLASGNVIDLTDSAGKTAAGKTPSSAPARQLSFPARTTAPHSPAKKVCPDRTSESAAVVSKQSPLNLPHLVMLTDKPEEEITKNVSSPPITVPSAIIPMETFNIPVAVAQPFFMNYQIPSAVYHSPSGGRFLSRMNSAPFVQQLRSLTGSSTVVKTPEVQKKKLTAPLQYEKGLHSSTTMQLRAKLAEKRLSSQTSKDGSIDEGMESEGNKQVRKAVAEEEVVTEGTVLQTLGKGGHDRNDVAEQSSTGDQDKEVMKAKDGDVSPATPNKDVLSKTVISLLLCGHSYPSLCGATHISFCCVQKLQPMYVQIGKNRKISMYSNWRVASHNPNPEGLTSKMLLSLYKSNYTSNPVVGESAMMETSEGILTHSSYWTYKRKQNGEEHKVTDPCSKVVEVVDKNEDGEEMEQSVPAEPSVAVESKAGEDRKVKEVRVAKRIQICQGGYKTSEDYVYVRGRGRGKYVCETCGIRCKKPSMLKKHIRTHTDFRPYNCRHCRFSFKTKGNLTKHMKSKAHQKKCLEIGVIPVPISIDETQIDNEALAAQCAIANDARIADAEMFPTFPPETEEDNDDGDDDEEEDEEDEELDEGDNSGVQETTVENTDVVSKDLEMTCLSPDKTDNKTSSPVFVALQVSDSSQPALVPIATPASRPDSLFSFTKMSSARRTESEKSMASRNIDTEIAHSLLDLSKKAEKGESTSTDLTLAEGQRGITRLDSLIGALMSRTKPLSGLKPQEDGSMLMMKISQASDSETKASTSVEVHAADNFVFAMVSLPPDSENQSTTVGVPVMLTSPATPGLQGSFINPSLIAFLPPYATVPLSRQLATHGPIIGQMILQDPVVPSEKVPTLPQILLPNFVPVSSTSSSSVSTSSSSSSSSSSSVIVPVSHPWTVGSLPFQFSHPFGGILTPTPTESLPEQTFAALKTASDSPLGHTIVLTSATDKTGVASLVKDGSSGDSTDSQSKLAPFRNEDGQMVYIYPVPGSGNTSLTSPGMVLKEGAIILSPTEGAAANPQQQIVYLIGDVTNAATTVAEKKGMYTCNLCDTSFDQNYLLMLHRLNVHQNTLQCCVCHEDFSSEELLHKHQSSTGHKTPQETKNQSTALENKSTALEKRKTFPCSFCDIMFQQRVLLTKHLRSKLHVTTLERLGMLPAGTFQTLESAKEANDSQKNSSPDAHETSGGDLVINVEMQESVVSEEDGKGDNIGKCGAPTKRNVQSPFKGQFQVHQSLDYEKHDSASNEHVTVEINQKPIDLFDIRDIDTNVDNDEQENPAVSFCYKLSPNVKIGKGEMTTKTTESSVRISSRISTNVTSAPSLEYLLTSAAFSQIKTQSIGGVDEMAAVSANEQKTESPAVASGNAPSEHSTDGQVFLPNVSEGAHKCGICRTSFKGLDQLKSHLITHAELRPYVCEYCDAGFTNAHSLSSHLQTHKLFEPFSMTHERPYICGLCGDTFAEAGDLKAHHATHSRPLRHGLKSSQNSLCCDDSSTAPSLSESKDWPVDDGSSSNMPGEVKTEVSQTASESKIRSLSNLSGEVKMELSQTELESKVRSSSNLSGEVKKELWKTASESKISLRVEKSFSAELCEGNSSSQMDLKPNDSFIQPDSDILSCKTETGVKNVTSANNNPQTADDISNADSSQIEGDNNSNILEIKGDDSSSYTIIIQQNFDSFEMDGMQTKGGNSTFSETGTVVPPTLSSESVINIKQEKEKREKEKTGTQCDVHNNAVQTESLRTSFKSDNSESRTVVATEQSEILNNPVKKPDENSDT
ncbi:uncharacterized protein LOC121377316 [Gigantopelta aegis]|uniref:uncharacterized protein LOC121377316 n=1 Tax=Gigantopelta aegis TaxID=1735272 RepID=UPI001B88E4DC|nr:uncharacterized protein LOC121377316 [Gigantopelta aegis]